MSITKSNQQLSRFLLFLPTSLWIIIFGAVLAKTNVQLVLPNKLAQLGVVYDCPH